MATQRSGNRMQEENAGRIWHAARNGCEFLARGRTHARRGQRPRIVFDCDVPRLYVPKPPTTVLSHATPSHFCKGATEEVRRIRRLAEPRGKLALAGSKQRDSSRSFTQSLRRVGDITQSSVDRNEQA